MQWLQLVVQNVAKSSQAEQVVAGILSPLLAWLLTTFAWIQDLLLSLPSFRRLVLWANRAQFEQAVAAALRQPTPGCSFDMLDYYVDQQSRQTLQFAALHSLSTHLQQSEVLAPAQLLPPVSRVLLTTEERDSGRYLEAVAGALASQMQGGLLVVDAMLLASLAGLAFSRPPESFLSWFNAGGRGSSSSNSSGTLQAKLEVAWEALEQALSQLQQPTVCFIKSADQLLCGSWDAYDAFQAVLGNPELAALSGKSMRAPLVMLGACTLSESGASLAGAGSSRAESSAAAGDEEGSEGEDGGGRPGRGKGGWKGLFSGGRAEDFAMDDELGLTSLLMNLGRLAEEARPNARKLLPQLFPTRVKLQPPPAGPLALRHQQRLQQDQAQATEEENYRAAAAVAAGSGVKIPPKASGVYQTARGRPYSRQEWSKALSWAVTVETLRHRQEEGQREADRRQQVLEHARLLPPANGSADGSTAGELDISRGGRASELRRRTSEPAIQCMRDVSPESLRSPLPAPTAAGLSSSTTTGLATIMHTLLPRYLSPFYAAGLLLSLPRATLRWCYDAVASLPRRLLPWAPNANEGEGEGLADLDAELAALDSMSGSGSTSPVASGGQLVLSEQSLRYGLGMLGRSGGSIKQSVVPDNSYERQLLGEVLAAEDCGAGFSEVGALSNAKRALREAVQLPLRHPELFAGGALARPSKGVLLFGPPGTGKTLLARAAAAECGAAFLPINPSSVASKWFGDSVRYIRAAFTLAAKLSPCVIFIDEVDALLGRRNSTREHEALREMKNELMQQWEGIRPAQGGARVLVLAATNRPFDLDEAVLRRFTHRILIPLPDKKAREEVLGVILAGERLAPDVDVSHLAEQTEGFSGSDLKQLCVSAALRPVREFLEAEGKALSSSSGRAAALEARPAAATATAGDAEAGAESSTVAHGAESSAGHGTVVALATSSSSDGSAGLTLPHLGSLLRQAEKIAGGVDAAPAELRPISALDFDEARKEVTATVNPDSATVQELNQWNSQYGTSAGGRRAPLDSRLSYFM